MRKIFLILLMFSLAACNLTTPRRDTYDLINAEMIKASEGKAKPAQADAVAASLLPPLTIEMPKARKTSEERFNLTFNHAPAQQFFMSIASGTRYNMMVHPNVTGTISATLKDVTLFEALDAVRELYGYEYKVEGNRVYIKPLTLQTSIFRINYLNYTRKGASDIRVSSGSVSDSSQSSGAAGASPTSATGVPGASGTSTRSLDSSKITTSSNNNFWGELKGALDAIVGNKEGRSVVISPQSGVVVIRAMSDELRNVAAFLKATQLSVDRQVILEAKIMEVELNDGFQSGINWAVFGKGKTTSSIGMLSPGANIQASGALTGGTASGLTATSGSSMTLGSNAAGSLFGMAFQSSNFAGLISFLESQGTVHVLSSPRIATMNNEKAVLKVGTDEFFVTKITTTPGTAGSTTTQPTTSVEVQPFFSGVSLDVTPQIDEDDNIVLHVHPSVSKVSTVEKTIQLGTNYGGNMILPLASSAVSETDSVVRGKTGNIIAIGGLMRQASISDRSQLPGAGDLPLVGNLLRNTNRTTQKRELVILIKPTVVHGAGSWAQDMTDSQRRIQAMEPPTITGLQ